MTSPRRNGVDLHTHTTRSDGVLTAIELHAQMRGWGTWLAAVTDHDTLAGYRDLRAAGQTGEQGGPRIVPGIEINSVSDRLIALHGLGRTGDELHILGYGVDADDATFETTLIRQRASRETRVRLVVDRLRQIGKPIDDQIAAIETVEGSALGRPHVARAMIAAGYVESVDEAFHDWLGYGGPAFVPRQGLGPRECIEAISAAGGVAVLAHSPAADEHAVIVDRLIGWGLRGLEVHYRSFDPETVARLLAFAARHSLLVTGGSDYHGDLVTYAQAQATLQVPDSVGEALLAAVQVRA